MSSQNKARDHGIGPCPTFLVALTEEIASSNGSRSYREAGFELSRHLESQCPDHLDSGRWDAQLEALADHVRADDVRAIAGWFEQNLPRCIELVPKRRLPKFTEGVCMAAGKGVTDWFAWI